MSISSAVVVNGTVSLDSILGIGSEFPSNLTYELIESATSYFLDILSDAEVTNSQVLAVEDREDNLLFSLWNAELQEKLQEATAREIFGNVSLDRDHNVVTTVNAVQ